MNALHSQLLSERTQKPILVKCMSGNFPGIGQRGQIVTISGDGIFEKFQGPSALPNDC